MAFASDSTTAPARPLLPLVFRPVPPVDDPRSADELLDEIRLTIEGQVAFGFNRCDIPTHGPQADAYGYQDACHGDTPTLLPASAALPGSGDLKSATVADLAADQIAHCEHFAEHARTLHFRRQLHQALDHGFALLDALDLPPLALDVIDDAIATMDAMDAPEEDLEDGGDAEASLGWTAAGACSGYDFDDREHDTADVELSCGWTAKIDQVHLGHAQDDHETTALERHGKGFIRSGADDAEDDDRETVNEDGSDCGEASTPWWDRIGYSEMEVGAHG